jgi:hypothetical protein
MREVCPSCQNEVSEDQYFCFVCGARLYDLREDSKWRDKPLVGEDIPWQLIEQELCRAEEFIPFYTRESGKSRPGLDVPKKFPIYALLLVESATLNKGGVMPVLHHEDFCNLWTAFRERAINRGEGVFVAYTQFYKNRPLQIFKAVGPWWTKYIKIPKGLPRLHIYIYPVSEASVLNSDRGQPIAVWHPKGWKP